MNRIFIIIGALGLLGVVAVLLVISRDTSSVPVDNPPSSENQFPDSQVVTPLPVTNNEAPVVRNFALTPEDYVINEIPTSGLVTSVVSPNPSASFDTVLSELFLDVFWKLECELPDGTTEYALAVTAQPGVETGTIDLARYAIRNWEPFIAQDIGQTLFPNTRSDFSSTELAFSNFDVDSRFSTFSVDSTEYEIHYGWVLNFAMFASSHNCLVAAINDTYAPFSH